MSTLSNSNAVEFTLKNTLICHTKAINHLAISADQSCLISVADDSRTVVWSAASGEKLFVAERPFNGPATAVSWASRDCSRFVVGFASGDLHMFSNESGKSYHDSIGVSGGDGPVEGIAYDPINDRIACICEKSTQLWSIEGSELVPILQSPLVSRGYGRCVEFCDNGAAIVMYSLDNHECVCYRIEPWEKKWSKTLNTRIGCAALSHDGKHLFVSNLKDGVDEYEFPSLKKVQTFSHPILENYILQTRTSPSCRFVVVGGDDGFARVFNHVNGQLVGEIHHGEPGQLVQVVEAFVDSADRCVVITASTGKAPFDLKIWVYQPSKAPVSSSKEPSASLANTSSSTWRDLIVIAFLTFLLVVMFIMLLLAGIFFMGVPDIPDDWITYISRRVE